MKLRNIATAFLKNDDDYLMMERSKDNKRMPGYWYGVGGHIEPEEINNPYAACMREVFEETGLKEDDVENMKLKYIIMRRSKDETVINYLYFGETKTRRTVGNDEGTLHWIPEKEVLNRLLVDALMLALKHYFEYGRNSDEVIVGVLKKEDSNSAINWSLLQNMDE